MESSITQTMVSSFAGPQPQTQHIRLRITYTQHPEDQLLSLIKEKGSIMRSELPKNLRRTGKWALNLEKKGLIKRVHLKEGCAKRLQFVYIPQEGK
ncbi:MAG: hypothetical protein ACNA7I_06775 [Candidatus Methanoperedens sp.]